MSSSLGLSILYSHTHPGVVTHGDFTHNNLCFCATYLLSLCLLGCSFLPLTASAQSRQASYGARHKAHHYIWYYDIGTWGQRSYSINISSNTPFHRMPEGWIEILMVWDRTKLNCHDTVPNQLSCNHVCPDYGLEICASLIARVQCQN